ncbi:hypothetical protein [Actinophytocola sp.]|uniref:hypothetical protein n=1 Tax=Actinophytocola sp. TaxID=1872138 RepID=UPI0025C39F96|nr:hypothetical protein [Actinophytocola sp.]
MGIRMAVGSRVAGVLPLAGASLAAVALAGVAVFTVHQAGCTEPGRYVQHDDGQVELVDSCLDPAQLPPVTNKKDHPGPAEPALNELTKQDPVGQAR